MTSISPGSLGVGLRISVSFYLAYAFCVFGIEDKNFCFILLNVVPAGNSSMSDEIRGMMRILRRGR